MSITVRLKAETETKLANLAKIKNKTKSEIIREALDFYFKSFSGAVTPFELGKSFFGKHGSGTGTLSIEGEKILRQKIKEKHYGKSNT